MNDISKEYIDFMEWLQTNHPEISDKYNDNFSIPLKIGGGITVNSNNKISQEEYDMLYDIAHRYYTVNIIVEGGETPSETLEELKERIRKEYADLAPQMNREGVFVLIIPNPTPSASMIDFTGFMSHDLREKIQKKGEV